MRKTIRTISLVAFLGGIMIMECQLYAREVKLTRPGTLHAQCLRHNLIGVEWKSVPKNASELILTRKIGNGEFRELSRFPATTHHYLDYDPGDAGSVAYYQLSGRDKGVEIWRTPKVVAANDSNLAVGGDFNHVTSVDDIKIFINGRIKGKNTEPSKICKYSPNEGRGESGCLYFPKFAGKQVASLRLPSFWYGGNVPVDISVWAKCGFGFQWHNVLTGQNKRADGGSCKLLPDGREKPSLWRFVTWPWKKDKEGWMQYHLVSNTPLDLRRFGQFVLASYKCPAEMWIDDLRIVDRRIDAFSSFDPEGERKKLIKLEEKIKITPEQTVKLREKENASFKSFCSKIRSGINNSVTNIELRGSREKTNSNNVFGELEKAWSVYAETCAWHNELEESRPQVSPQIYNEWMNRFFEQLTRLKDIQCELRLLAISAK